ncbi:MAG TPA: aromatic amino acid hydroxylase [Lentimicrobium sp.]|nr:aromatic amino acid hydroxylase [Lentimicrobium sp.]
MEMNEVLEKLPAHLMSLVIEQPYNEYTSRDHAVWRYVMRQNVRYLSKVAHGSYLDGLKKTGISIDSIPHMYGMNRILKEIGWAAVAVDGFIPPSAFMEFQAYNVLVIAADIRPFDQLEYTPAPDIIHEAAGHAPIIADDEYAQYLKFFGEIGSKALSSARDYELYEAVRHLSILKADPYSSKADIESAEKHLAYIDSTMGEPSEMALIRNLHWWTVEYGLIGTIESPKIYGAGLLSSIGESYNCLQPHVKKLPYSLETAWFNFDITTQQPQLFVTPDFKHLSDVLNQFADTMALRKGGILAVIRAENSSSTATTVLDSGIQVSGTFKDSIIEGEDIIYLRTTGPTALAYNNKELIGHGKAYHHEGYGTPVGHLINAGRSLHEMSESELGLLGISPNKDVILEFNTGVKVKGHLIEVLKKEGKNLLFTFGSCTVSYNNQILFQPSWGRYDMLAGREVTSAYSGPADPDAFQLSYKAPAETTHKIIYSEADRKLHALYQKIRDLRESKEAGNQAELLSIWNEIITNYPAEWLIMLELLELSNSSFNHNSLTKEIYQTLEKIENTNTSFKKLIKDGLEMILSSKVTEGTP